MIWQENGRENKIHMIQIILEPKHNKNSRKTAILNFLGYDERVARKERLLVFCHNWYLFMTYGYVQPDQPNLSVYWGISYLINTYYIKSLVFTKFSLSPSPSKLA